MSQPKKMRGPNKEKCEMHFRKQRKLGLGPQHRGFPKESQRTRQVGVGPNTEMRNTFPQAKEVEFQQKNYVKIVPCF